MNFLTILILANTIFTPGENAEWYSFSAGEVKKLSASGTAASWRPSSEIISMVYCGKNLFAGDKSRRVYQCDADLKSCKSSSVPFSIKYMTCISGTIYMAGNSIKVLKSDSQVFKPVLLWEHSSWVTGLGILSGNILSCSWDRTCRTGKSGTISRRFSNAVSFIAVGKDYIVIATDDLRLSLVETGLRIKSFIKSNGVAAYMSPIDNSNRFAVVSVGGNLYKYQIVDDRIKFRSKIKNVSKTDVWLEKGVLKYTKSGQTRDVF
ncbi:hypothetical protein KKF34_16935 [Myxococcota bacterium]|nr:hypothetical protein [Myxococcota bacterium]MBU1379854.1 hypothetical protein [Myxococcota bacterium]MBU1498565.1 hypothetical protein [Myxococcota bacterium]